MPALTHIADLKALHRRRVPKMFYDYCESGSWSEQTFRENESDFQALRLRQRVAVDIAARSTAAPILGQEAAMPLAIAPVGLLGMQSADGEIKAARAAEAFGVPFCLSTMSIASIEDVAAHTSKPFWMQIYTLNDWDYMERLIDRTRKARCSAIVITLDLQVQGQRHIDIKNGLSAPPRPTPRTLLNLASKWAWGLEMLGTKRRSFGNVIGHAKGVENPADLMSWTAKSFDQSLDWDKVARLRDMWGGKVILKGILDPDDARRAADLGVDGIVVSNHGGRQLDGALSSIRAFPAIRRAVGGQLELMLDGGIRSGQDVLKAVAMGADAVMSGRAMVYGLGARGQAGVTQALEMIQTELDRSMALCGKRSIAELGPDTLLIPEAFEGRWQNAPS